MGAAYSDYLVKLSTTTLPAIQFSSQNVRIAMQGAKMDFKCLNLKQERLREFKNIKSTQGKKNGKMIT